MVLRPEFSMGHSSFNEFLWASTGIDENGAPVSVLSALARLGFDPWTEAARLTALPEEAAIAALATLLARLRRSDAASPSDVTTACRLAAMLRGCAAIGVSPDKMGRRLLPGRLSIMLVALVLSAILAGAVLYQSWDRTGDRPPSFTFTMPAS